MEVQLSGGDYGGLIVNFENIQTTYQIINTEYVTFKYELNLNSEPLVANLIDCFQDNVSLDNNILKLKQINVWELIKIERERKNSLV